MIDNFYKVNDKLYRGAAPHIADLKMLKDKFNIQTIVSLDEICGKKINRMCKLLEIKHIQCSINPNIRSTHLKCLKEFPNLFNDITFVHCRRGKDRTGFLIAMYRCIYDGWSCKEALLEAIKFGFGTGLSESVFNFYKKIISKACSKNHQHVHIEDVNDADIVSNTKDITREFRDFALDGEDQQSWSPYEDYRIKRWPDSDPDKQFQDQYSTRQDYGLNGIFDIKFNPNAIPQSGVYDQNTQGINGAGPSLVGSGFL